jgi:hypothetical protein
MKYAVTYLGVVTGSFGGRDDGYPEYKSAVLEQDSDLIRFKNCKELKVYQLSSLSSQNALNIIQKEENKLRDKKKQLERTKEQALTKLNSTEKKLLGL